MAWLHDWLFDWIKSPSLALLPTYNNLNEQLLLVSAPPLYWNCYPFTSHFLKLHCNRAEILQVGTKLVLSKTDSSSDSFCRILCTAIWCIVLIWNSGTSSIWKAPLQPISWWTSAAPYQHSSFPSYKPVTVRDILSSFSIASLLHIFSICMTPVIPLIHQSPPYSRLKVLQDRCLSPRPGYAELHSALISAEVLRLFYIILSINVSNCCFFSMLVS